ncbi:MAG TPA: hypothetical protein VHE35_36555, partial [Kofleriaceae bacterium]|nr:hypothetical protein [Kofleriaceae bacterium]
GAAGTAGTAATGADADEPAPPSSLTARYFDELAKLGLVDTRTGSSDTLTADLAAAEQLLRDGAAIDAAVALATIVDSPRYADFTDRVEYQNAEYYLGVALHAAGAEGAALDALERVLRRGPDAPYWGPAHRRAVDIAIETRDFAGVLARLESIQSATPIPPSAAGERAYLRGRAAYVAGDLVAAEGDLATISRKSRLYSSALYLRGVIRAQKGEWRDAAAAMCEIAATPDTDKFTFVVDERYFTIKDLARLGLARIAHEQGEYDDAYYHYFQIPSDSQSLPDALFEASWSMYQKRELATARDLLVELARTFPDNPQWPEAGLLAGYVELADCKFDDARKDYEALIAQLEPVVAELDRLRKDPDARGELFRRAVEKFQAQADTGAIPGARDGGAPDATERVLDLLRLDPAFLRLHEAATGMQRAAGEAPGVVAAWTDLTKRLETEQVGAVTGETTSAEDEAAGAAAVHGDLRRLAAEVDRAKEELARGHRDGTVPDDVVAEEGKRLDDLGARVDAAAEQARAYASKADDAIAAKAPAGLQPLLADDLARARRLDRAAQEIRARLERQAELRSAAMVEALYHDVKKVLDKARLGRVDSVIGQKRELDIEVQDLAAGRFPAELHGKLWEEGLIGDDEEYWPPEGEYWADEYKGWR